jgi:hypothetical protein
MPLLAIHRKTEYCYTRPVVFGEHRIMLRPSDAFEEVEVKISVVSIDDGITP